MPSLFPASISESRLSPTISTSSGLSFLVSKMAPKIPCLPFLSASSIASISIAANKSPISRALTLLSLRRLNRMLPSKGQMAAPTGQLDRRNRSSEFGHRLRKDLPTSCEHFLRKTEFPRDEVKRMTSAFCECGRELFSSKRATVCVPYRFEGRFEEVLTNFIRGRDAVIQIENDGFDHPSEAPTMKMPRKMIGRRMPHINILCCEMRAHRSR
jgi:hypothetical protein